ncbi:hypothetical protein [Streptomyces sp. NPDC002187]|uniref:hypothetical protein n=1 Tax=Streptomyces sp. NPDC002187 TaxID=3364637 RepID=UPI00368E9E0A
MASDLERGVEALKKFRSKVDGVLKDLEGGDGGAAKVAMERVTRSSLGVGSFSFGEADDFHSEYKRIHMALVSLSKSLGDQIEMLSIGVLAADIGYTNVDEDKRRQFHEIQARLAMERDAAADRKAEEEREKAGGDKPAGPDRQNAKGGTYGGEYR